MSSPEITVLVDAAAPYRGQVDAEQLGRAVRAALRAAGRDSTPLRWRARAPAEVSIRVTDDEEMRRLNREYRGLDRPTDILSFSFVADDGPDLSVPPDWPMPLGEIAISRPHAERQAAELNHSTELELAWLTVHGTLQLLGYAHETEEEAQRMEALEREALRMIGFEVQ